MSKPTDDPYAALERAFHEPKRLAILSALIGSDDQELSFNELKRICALTDGNLNRHLKMLEEAGAVAFRKTARTGRTQTVVSLTQPGRRGFLQYLEALEAVLKKASAAAGRAAPEPSLPTHSLRSAKA
ncbi:MAG TPA: transcriptional regulator [Opitutaceae bacterium]|nr:transcriptional regulator [Opitutaceae bacterium]